VFSNGYNSTNHRAALFVVDLETGELLRKFLVGGGSESDPNGLASPVLLGMEPGSVGSDTAYAGDLHGNVWRFDLSGEPSEWEVGVGGLPLFSAVDADGARQPITGGLDVIAHPDSGSIVFFGTGQYFLIGDNVVDNDPQVQSFYAIWDNDLSVGGRNELLEQTIESETGGLRTMSDNTLSWANHKGWFVDLQVEGQEPLGERFISRPQVRLGKVFFPTFRPTGDQCSPGGENVLMVLNASSGRPGITAPTGDCTANCGGVQLPPGPPSAPPPVIIAPPNDGKCRPGIDPGCEPPCDPETDSECAPSTCDPVTDPTCPCPASNPNCRTQPPANVCGNFIIPIPGQPPLVFARPCGRQSWRQLR
jgi:type IV pilus assembly protein PilY1